MSFKLYQRGAAGDAPLEYIPCDDITVAVGDALVFSSGHAIKATGTTKPEFICAMAGAVAADGDRVPAIRVTDDQVWETQLSEASASIAVGTKYTIAASAAGITATSTSGVAEVLAFEGKASGDRVLVKF